MTPEETTTVRWKIWTAIVVGGLVGFVMGVYVGGCEGEAAIRREAVRAGVATYKANLESGEAVFVWRDSVRLMAEFVEAQKDGEEAD